MKPLVVLLLALISSSVLAEEESRSVSLADILKTAETSAPAVLLERLEAKATRSKGLSGVGKIVPELGVEGGARSNREKEKRNDLFYYGYARYELSLSEIGEIRAGLARKDLGNLMTRLAKAKAGQSLAVEFFKVLSIQKQIELKENDLTSGQKQTAAAKKRVDAGLATESDILEFKMHQSNLENDLRILRNDLSLGLKDLARLSGLNFSISKLEYEIKDSSQPQTLNNVINNALANSVELEKKRAEYALAVSEKMAAVGEYLPRLSAEGLYGKVQETDFIESRKNSWAVVGKVTIPLFNGGSSFRKSQEKGAEADRAELELKLETVRTRQLAESLVNRQSELSEKLRGEKENVDISQKYFELVISEYRRGVKNSQDVASATDKLFDAKWRLFEAWRDLSLAVIELNMIQGNEWSL